MSRAFVSASSECIYGGATVTPYPFTLAAWFKADSLPGETEYPTIVSISDGDASHYCSIFIDGANSRYIGMDAYEEGSYACARTTAAPTSTGVWYHAAGVSAGAAERYAYLNGGNVGSNAVGRSPTGVDTTAVGAVYVSGVNFPFDGKIAEVGIWNVALTAGEIAILAAGYCPLFVRPGNLICYLPLVQDADEDVVGGLSFSAVATPTVDSHPRIIYPISPYSPLVSAGEAGGSVIPLILQMMRRNRT